MDTISVVGSGVRNVIRDDLLYAGTKQRVASQYIKNCLPIGIKNLLYTSSYNGYGHVVTAFVAQEIGIKCTVVLALKAFGSQHTSSIKDAEQSSSVKKCRELGATVIYANTWNQLVQLGQQISADPLVHWLPLGFKDDRFVDLLATNIRETMLIKPKRMWVVGGCGVLAKALSSAFPECHIFVVPVDIAGSSYHKLVSYIGSLVNVTIHKQSSQSLPCPYPTITGYDSKAWDASVKYGQDGDYVWNVAC